jgi:short-subunit dehydrogenase
LVSTLKPITLITGASAGIGAAFARICAEKDHEIVLVARREGQLAALAEAIALAGWRRPQTIAVDLSLPGNTDQLANELARRGLEPAIVINCAGYGLRGQAAELDRINQLGMIDLNIRTLTDLSLRFIDSVTRHAGGIINVASVAAFFPGPGMAVYYASKAYVLALSEALHSELAPRGVRVTTVCPGPVPTEFHARAGVDGSRLPRSFTRTAERVAREGYEGFLRGRRIVVTGGANKLVISLYRFLPRALVLRLAQTYQLQ